MGVEVGLTDGKSVGSTEGVALGKAEILGVLVGHGVPPFPFPFPPLDGGIPSTHVGGGAVGEGLGSTQFPHSQQVKGQTSFTSSLSQYLLILSIFVDNQPHFLTRGTPSKSLLISNEPLVSSHSSAKHLTKALNKRKTDDAFIIDYKTIDRRGQVKSVSGVKLELMRLAFGYSLTLSGKYVTYFEHRFCVFHMHVPTRSAVVRNLQP